MEVISYTNVYVIHRNAGVSLRKKSLGPALQPFTPVILREYRLVSREEVASRSFHNGHTPEKEKNETKEIPCTISTSVKHTSPLKINSPEKPEIIVKPIPVISTEKVLPTSILPLSEENEKEELKEVKSEILQENIKPDTVPEIKVIQNKGIVEKKQQTLFGKSLSGVKQTRSASSQVSKKEPKTKLPRTSKNNLEKNEETTSLMKLAKASLKKKNKDNITESLTDNNITNNERPKKIIKREKFLDEDEEKSQCSSNISSNDNFDNGFMEEDVPTFDITASSTVNDDIIICDDAPPMIFCVPELINNSSKKENQQQQQQQQHKKNDGDTFSSTQPKLTGFFLPEVVSFQTEYSREITTETVFENDEYICKDKICYRHNKTNEIISEHDYFKKTSEIIKKVNMSNQNIEANNNNNNNNNKSKSSSNGKSSTPAVLDINSTLIETSKGSKPLRVERQVRSQPKTLMSYFKTA